MTVAGELEQSVDEGRRSERTGALIDPPPVAKQEDGAGRIVSRLDVWLAAGAGLAALLVYRLTLSCSIAWGDSPELTTAAFLAGIPHPTGYPLYMLLGFLFTHLWPAGSVAFRMNLLSALSAAGAIAFTYLLLRRLVGGRLVSLMAALGFAFSPMFWSQAVIAEVYAFHLLGMTALLWLVLSWERRGGRGRLRGAALMYGLCFTHHMLSVLLLPGLLYLALTSRRRGEFVGELGRTVPLFLLPLLLYAYLPLAAHRDPAANWGDPGNWHNFVAHITGRQYRTAMFHVPADELWLRVKSYTGLGPGRHSAWLAQQFTPGFLWLAPLGIWGLARRRRRFLVFTLLIYAVVIAYTLNYYIFDSEVYYLPSHLMVAIWIAAGLRQLGGWLAVVWRRLALPPAKRRPINALLGGALVALPLTLLSANWSANDHHSDRSALMYARAALMSLKPNALLLSGDDNYYFPLLYARHVDHFRPDVTLVDFYDLVLRPERLRLTTRLRNKGAGFTVHVPPNYGRRTPDIRVLQNLIAENVDRRPIYLLVPPSALSIPWLGEATAPYYRIADSNVPSMELSRKGPSLAVVDPHPSRAMRVMFGMRRPDGRIVPGLELLGFDMTPRWQEGVPWMKIAYYWRVHDQAFARPAHVWVLFTDASGNYQRKEDGAPELQNIHPLAYGMGQGKAALPAVLRETYQVYIPPGEWNQRLRMRVAVALGKIFMANTAGSSQWVELGEMPMPSDADQPTQQARRE
jgi:hypothetical protein